MMNKPKRPPSSVRRRHASKMMSRIMSSMPAATFEMETFARLADVVTSDEVPTAAMECKHRPRLLLNPDFVRQHCKRDEHLFLLVMHELWHVLLAHTSLYPRVTQAQNIAFDAIINAGLMRRFKEPAYMGFFDKLNPPDKFPHLLLRPPVGWPDNPQYPDGIGPQGTSRIIRQLYPATGAPRPTMPFYDEILTLIKKDLMDKGMLIEVPMLLGDHESRDPYTSTYLKDAMGRMAQKWPIKASDFGPPGQGGNMGDWQLNASPTTQAVRRTFANVLRRALGTKLGEYRRKERRPIQDITGMGVLPNARDRMRYARAELGVPNTLWAQKGTYKARVPERKVKSHVYLDVSGSMSGVLPYLLNLILPYVADGRAEVFQFSTEVDHLPMRDLQKGLVRSTGGTQILCVMEHLLEHSEKVKRALILTDGYTGRPHHQHIAKIQEDAIQIHLVLPHESPHQYDLQTISKSVTVLPPIR